MATEFVKCEKRVQTVVDVCGPLGVIMSVRASDKDQIDLVIGASFRDRYASSFNKASLRELIQILEEIQEAM